jgi:ABC-type hemin transport system ATPase subunit
LIVVTHDLNLAQSFCDRLIFMKSGEIVADVRSNGGPPEVSPALIEQVFEVRAGAEFSPERQPRIVLQFGK